MGWVWCGWLRKSRQGKESSVETQRSTRCSDEENDGKHPEQHLIKEHRDGFSSVVKATRQGLEIVDNENSYLSSLEVPLAVRYRDVSGHKFVNQYEKVGDIARSKVCSVKLYQYQGKYFAFKCYQKCTLQRKLKYCGSLFGDNTDGKRTSMKDFSAAVRVVDYLRREIEILMRLKSHECICPLLAVLDGVDSEKLYLVLPYYDRGPLMHFDSIQRVFYRSECNGGVIPFKLALSFALDVSHAIDYIHGKRIVHRDIKPGNILTYLACHDDTPTAGPRIRAVLSDFSCSHYFKENEPDGQLCSTEGTYLFYSPEICEGGSFNAYAADIWAFGVTFFAMLFGKPPFDAAGQMEFFDSLRNSNTEKQFPAEDFFLKCPRLKNDFHKILKIMKKTQLMSLLDSILCHEPTLRATAPEIVKHITELIEKEQLEKE